MATELSKTQVDRLGTEIAGRPAGFREKLISFKQDVLEELRSNIESREKLKGEGDDISD
jgi:hypothetical protein